MTHKQTTQDKCDNLVRFHGSVAMAFMKAGEDVDVLKHLRCMLIKNPQDLLKWKSGTRLRHSDGTRYIKTSLGLVNLEDGSTTERARVSYPIEVYKA